jgi:hypothetical protein
MTRKEYADSKGITTAQLREIELEFLQCEGYDDAGRKYDTLDAWIDRKPVMESRDLYDGGRGAGMFGIED